MAAKSPIISAKSRHIPALLRRGAVIAYPTESCYGLGCDPSNRKAVRRVLRIKRRPQRKGLILVAADRSLLLRFADAGQITPALSAHMARVWPGPVTLVLPAGRRAGSQLRGQHAGIALRQSAHPPLVRLCQTARMALVSTSANPVGKPPARQRSQLRRYFGQRLDAIIKGPVGTAHAPSRIEDVLSGRVLRAG